MTWTRLSDDYPDKNTVAALSDSAFRLDVEAMVYCNRLLTDGFLPSSMLHRITGTADPEAAMRELVESGLWDEVEGGYQRDWSEQESRAVVEKRRADHAESQRRFNERRLERTRRHEHGDHSLCQAPYCSAIRAGMSAKERSDVSGDASLTSPYPTRPNPTRPEGEGKGAKRGSRAVAPKRRSAASSPEELDDQDWIAPPGTKERQDQETRLNEAIREDGYTDAQAWKADGGLQLFIEEERLRMRTREMASDDAQPRDV